MKSDGGLVYERMVGGENLLSALSLSIYFSLLFCWNAYFFADKVVCGKRVELKDGVIGFFGDKDVADSGRLLVNNFLLSPKMLPK